MSDLLLFNQSLVVLDLRGNGLKDAGAAAISAALKGHSNENLTELDMGYNEITNDGAVSVAQVCFASRTYGRTGGQPSLLAEERTCTSDVCGGYWCSSWKEMSPNKKAVSAFSMCR